MFNYEYIVIVYTGSSCTGTSCKFGCTYSENTSGVATITAKTADGASTSFNVRTFNCRDKDGDQDMGMEWC